MIEATLFTNFRICGGNMLLFTILDDILCGKYEVPVNLHRAALQASDTSTAERIKKALPAFTVSATYRNARRIEQLTGYNPLQILDIDNLDPADISRLRKQVNDAPLYGLQFSEPRCKRAEDYRLHGSRYRTSPRKIPAMTPNLLTLLFLSEPTGWRWWRKDRFSVNFCMQTIHNSRYPTL